MIGLKNPRTTVSRSAPKSAEVPLSVWWRGIAACALLKNPRTTDSPGTAKSAEFFFRLAPPSPACALLKNPRTTDSPGAAKSAEFFFRFAPPPPACALLKAISAVLACAVAASAATSTSWEVSGFQDFLKGRLSGVALDASGRLGPGLSTTWVAGLGQPALWSVVPAADGGVYAATGHSGKVLRIAPDGKVSTVWSAAQTEVFALCIDRSGRLYAGTSPSGGLYRIENGNAQEVWHSPAKYIWSLQAAPDGAVFIGTGEAGRVYRFDGQSKTDVYYETGQANVTALALGKDGRLYAGTDPNGLLYRISATGRGTVVYDSTLPEIRAIVVRDDNTIYAAAMGGAVASRTAGAVASPQAAAGAVVAATPTVITVTAGHTTNPSAEDEQAAKPAEQNKAASGAAAAANAATTGAVTEVSGVEKSAIYRIQPNGGVETVRSSKEDNVYALLLDGNSLLFSTDDRGRIYRIADGRISLVAEPGSGETTQLLEIGGALYAALSNSARLIQFGRSGAAASYESQVHDATSVARWGHLQWHGTGGGITFRTRSGFSARPDATWSEWSDPIPSSGETLVKSPPARFIQLRTEWAAGADAQINTIDIPYLSQNGAPAVRSITVSSIVGTNPAKTGGSAAPASSAYSITVTDTGEAPAASSSSSGSQVVSRLQTTQTQISWQADDPDGDKLVYSIYFRAENESGWQLIRSSMFENTLLLDPDVFADGRYFFRVVASDAPSNAPEFAHQAELISSPVLIDNTPPMVTLGEPRRDGASADVDVDARDVTSTLRLCEYSLDAGTWQPIESVDGITDSPRERFRVHLEKLKPGEHLLVVRVFDRAGNAGLAKVVLR